MGITVAPGQKRVPSIHVLQFADDNGELCFLLVHKEASKAKGEHDPNFPSSVLLAFLLQTSSASCFQWYVCVPHAALATAFVILFHLFCCYFHKYDCSALLSISPLKLGLQLSLGSLSLFLSLAVHSKEEGA